MKDPRVYLAQILERIERVQSYTKEGKDAFLSDPKTQDAVIRNFEVIGEAVKRIPPKFRKEYPGLPWKGMAAFRDVLIHQYEGVENLEVWQIIEFELPRIYRNIKEILPPLDQLEKELAGETNGKDDV